MSFQFATAAQISFGPGKVHDVPAAARRFGARALLVTGHSADRAASLVDGLSTAGVATFPFSVTGEPTIFTAREGTELARAENCNLVISFGGGSAIDAGKAIAAILSNGGDPLDYIEVVGQGLKIHSPSAPFIAIPTTAGTGTEVTRNAVLASPEHRVKASLRSPYMLPSLAVVDPELTLDLPAGITAATGLDALTQLIEPYVSARANEFTDLFCLEGMRRAARSLRRAFEAPHDIAARSAMSFASLMGGLALTNAGLGVVHGFAAPIGGMFPAPHGAICAALLPSGMDVNLRALRARAPDHGSLPRYETIARILTGNPEARPEDGVEWIHRLTADLAIPGLAAYGLSPDQVPAVVEKAARASSMKANAIPLTTDELTKVLTRAI